VGLFSPKSWRSLPEISQVIDTSISQVFSTISNIFKNQIVAGAFGFGMNIALSTIRVVPSPNGTGNGAGGTDR
jgi:hypothetical protein